MRSMLTPPASLYAAQNPRELHDGATSTSNRSCLREFADPF